MPKYNDFELDLQEEKIVEERFTQGYIGTRGPVESCDQICSADCSSGFICQ